jgi:hypothetical protein
MLEDYDPRDHRIYEITRYYPEGEWPGLLRAGADDIDVLMPNAMFFKIVGAYTPGDDPPCELVIHWVYLEDPRWFRRLGSGILRRVQRLGTSISRRISKSDSEDTPAVASFRQAPRVPMTPGMVRQCSYVTLSSPEGEWPTLVRRAADYIENLGDDVAVIHIAGDYKPILDLPLIITIFWAVKGV